MPEWESLFQQEDPEVRRALDKAMEYLSLRDHSSGELYDKVRKKLENDQAAAAAVARCNELGLLNDEAFARHRAKYLLARGKSPRQIQGHLQEKGVPRPIAAQAVEELLETEDPTDTVYALIEKTYGRKLEQGKRDTVIAALARRGFAYGDIKTALARWQEQNDLPEAGEETGDDWG